MLLHGTSGGPIDWLTKAHLAPILSAFARAHHGATPVVVMPDINGAVHADTECVHAATGDVEQYLSVDVPRYVSSHFPATSQHSRWGIAGLSEGGVCALMLSLRHPSVFATFADLGGLARPTVGNFDAPAATLKELFAGSLAAYRQHDPTWLLTHGNFPTLTGWFECGSADRVLRDQERLVRLSRAARISVVASTTPGAHSWPVWRRTTQQVLAWFWGRTA